MSHSSGISVSDELAEAFRGARAPGAEIRALKVQIENEALVLTAQHTLSGDLEADFHVVEDSVSAGEASYVVVRLDTEHPEHGFHWLMVTFVPDDCPVRHKMLYASTRDNLKKQLGRTYITQELHATLVPEVTWDGYQAFLAGEDLGVEDVLTWKEKQKREEETATIHVGATRSGVHGVDFPLTPDALAAVQEFASGSHSYIQIALDTEAEHLALSASGSFGVDELPAQVCDDAPRYHLFRYEHEHEGESLAPVFFIYSCPIESAIKERMLYSSCKSACMEQCKEQGITFDHKMEITEKADVDEHTMQTTVHPPVHDPNARKFSKPKMAGRGGRRRPRRRE